jgi:hypothetical protein
VPLHTAVRVDDSTQAQSLAHALPICK